MAQEDDPFAEALSQLNDVVALLAKNAGRPIPTENVPVDFEQTLSNFEKKLELFRQQSELLQVQAGIEPTTLHRIIEQVPDELPSAYKKHLRQLKRLKKSLAEAYESNKKERGQAHSSNLSDKKHAIGARKNKFKQFGQGDWQRM